MVMPGPSRALIVATAGLTVRGAFAQLERCSNGLLDPAPLVAGSQRDPTNESDVDCGGECSPCVENFKCFSASDCGGEDPSCVLGGICFDTAQAKFDGYIYTVYLFFLLALLATHVLCECRARAKERLGSAKRRNKKAKAEVKRQEAADAAEAAERAEREDRRHSALVAAAYAKRLAELGEMSDSDSDSSDDEDGDLGLPAPKLGALKAAASKKGKGRLKNMVSAILNAGSSRNLTTTQAPTASSAKVDNESVGESNTESVVVVPVAKPVLSENEKAAKAAKKEKKRLAKKMAKAAIAGPNDDPLEEAARMRSLFIGRLAELHHKSKAHVGRIREDAAIVNVNTRLLKEERAFAVTKLRILTLVLLKPGTLVNLKEDEVEHVITETERANELVKGVLRGKGNNPEGDLKTLQKAVDLLDELSEQVGSPLEADYFCSAAEVMHWELGDAQLTKLQLSVEAELESKKSKKKKLEESMMLANSSFVDLSKSYLSTLRSRESGGWRGLVWKVLAWPWPNFMRLYPLFYAGFFGFMGLVGLPFLRQVGSVQSNDDFENGPGQTFLPLPPYYNMDDYADQRVYVPLIYGIMHMAMYLFCWLPVPFYRGFWRLVSQTFPSSRRYIPIDDFIFFHKLLGIMILVFLLSGGFLFMASLFSRCKNENDARSCFGLDPLPPAESLLNPQIFDALNSVVDLKDPVVFSVNPFDNVLALRKVVCLLWFTVFPMLHWARSSPPVFLPSFVKRYYWEIAYYAHLFVAYVSLTIALISRFQVFYPSAITWGVYFLDLMYETVLRTHSTEIVIRPTYVSQEEEDDDRTTLIHTDPSGVPTSIKLRMEVPAGFKIKAGQFVYLKIPSISKVQWHPFSLASGSRDDFVELQIGVIGNKSLWSKDDKGEWKMVKRPTFTYNLQKSIRDRITKMSSFDDPERQAEEVAPLTAQLRGPYGSTFTKCFNPAYSGCIIMGAGTGLTAALSVLRELMVRKTNGDRVPKYCWFVWSCSRVSDLLWLWDTLHELIMDGIKKDIIKPGKKWSRSSNMLGWLGVTLYVTRADKPMLREFVNRPIVTNENALRKNKLDAKKIKGKRSTMDKSSAPDDTQQASTKEDKLVAKAKRLSMAKQKEPGPERTVQLAELRSMWQSTNTNVRQVALATEVHHWMGHEKRLLASSMDDGHTHVSKLMAWARTYLDRKAGRGKKLAMCFCGPPGLCHSVAEASKAIGGNFEFSADHL